MKRKFKQSIPPISAKRRITSDRNSLDTNTHTNTHTHTHTKTKTYDIGNIGPCMHGTG